MHSIPSFVLGILAVCAFLFKFAISVTRLYRKQILVESILEVVCCFLSFIVSTLLLAFSIRFNETALEVLLSLIGIFMIVYQCAFLWRFYNNYYDSYIRWIRWIRWVPVVLQILSAVFVLALSGLIAVNQGHTKAWKITTLSFFAAEYVLLDALYLWIAYRSKQSFDNGAYSWAQSVDTDCKGVMCGGRIIWSNIFIRGPDCVRCILWWNVLSGAIALVLAIVSLSLFLLGQTNYVISLWIDIEAAAVWIVRWAVVQSYRLMKDSNVSSLRRVIREPRFRRKRQYCCRCNRRRKYDSLKFCTCKHERCDDCKGTPKGKQEHKGELGQP